MSDSATVKAAVLTFGAAGTQSSQAAASTSTSNPYPMPRADYTVQVTVAATGTSGVGATAIWQGSNDNLAWIPITSATTTATQAGTGTTYAAAAMEVGQKRYAYGRLASLVVSGTGVATANLGS